jgi:hypothetical protein
LTITELLKNPWIAATVSGVSVTTIKFVADVFISSLPAPTAQSTGKYRYWFTVANKFAANWGRAKNTAVESSPNWIPAVNHLNAQVGNPISIVEPPPPKP